MTLLPARRAVLALGLLLAGCGDALLGGDGPPDPPSCATAADCPGEDSECALRTCVSGSCGALYAQAGTPLAGQTPGNCRAVVCDGAGTAVSIADDADVPAGGQCAAAACANGEPTLEPAPAGTPCAQGGGLLCDGSGRCVGCLVAADCPGEDAACAARACYAGECGFTNAGYGTVVQPDVPGDCRGATVCDGYGFEETPLDYDDVPVDGNACTADVCTNVCSPDVPPVCVGGVPVNPPEPAGTPCSEAGATRCDGGGACVECLAGADCPSGVCDAGVCAP